LQQAGAVREAVGVATADDGDVVRALADRRKQIGNLDARFTALDKLARRTEQWPRVTNFEERILVEVWDRLAVTFVEFGFRIEQLDLAWAAVHEQEDARLRPGGVVRVLRSQGRFGCGRGARGVREEAVLGQHVSKRR